MATKKKGLNGKVPVRYMVEDATLGKTKSGKAKKKTVEFQVEVGDGMLPSDDQLEVILLGALSKYWSSSHPEADQCVVDEPTWEEVAHFFTPGSGKKKTSSGTPVWCGVVKKAFTSVGEKTTVVDILHDFDGFEDVPEDIKTIARVIANRKGITL